MTERHPFHVLLPQHALPLRRRALILTTDLHRAEDLVQSTLLKAWISRDSFRPESNMRAWLFTIMRNTFISEIRKYRREVADVDGSHAAAQFEEPSQDHTIALKELVSALALLPASQRRPLVLTGAYGFSQLEAADACQCAVGTIKSRVCRGRATLNRMLGHDEIARVTLSPRATREMPRKNRLPGSGAPAALMAADGRQS